MTDEEMAAKAAEEGGEPTKKKETKKTEEQTTEQPNQIEELAAKLGWNKDYEGENAVDAETFILNSKDIQEGMSKKIRGMSHQMDEMRRAVDMIAQQNRATVENTVKSIENQINALKNERVKAVEDGDVEKFNQLEQQINELQTQKPDTSAQSAQNSPPQEYIDWVAENQWYETDKTMMKWADTYLNDIPPHIKALGRSGVYDHIAKKAREVFPDKFEQPQKQETKAKPNVRVVQDVESPSKKTAHTKKFTFNDLSYTQKKVAEDFVGRLRGTKAEMTLDEYANQVLGGQ